MRLHVMERALLVIGVVLVALAVPLACVPLDGNGQETEDGSGQETEGLPAGFQDELFTAMDTTTVRMNADVKDAQMVVADDGRMLVLSSTLLGRSVAIDCECFGGEAPGCGDDSDGCKTTVSGGDAKCRGGCYAPDGTPCVSCGFSNPVFLQP